MESNKYGQKGVQNMENLRRQSTHNTANFLKQVKNTITRNWTKHASKSHMKERTELNTQQVGSYGSQQTS